MKVVGTILIILGLATVAISFAARAQFKKLVTSPTALASEDTRLLEKFYPRLSPTSTWDPHKIAQATSRRIYLFGAMGAVSAVVGIGVLGIGIRQGTTGRKQA